MEVFSTNNHPICDTRASQKNLPKIEKSNYGFNNSFSHENVVNTPSIIDILKNKKNKAKRRIDREIKSNRNRIDESFTSHCSPINV